MSEHELSASTDVLERLLPCPFCGGPVQLEEARSTNDYLYGNRRWWGVTCRNTINLGGTCCMDQVPSASKEAAISRWNMRNGSIAIRGERGSYNWIAPISGKASDLPIEGFVMLDEDIRGWAQARGMHLFYSTGSWHVMIEKTWCTVGYETPQKALEACWESGEYDDIEKCQAARHIPKISG